MTSAGTQVTVVGLGHTLLGDDAIGVAVVQAFERAYVIPPSVKVVDVGSCGLDLVGYLLDSERLIFVDALVADAPAGTVRTVDQEGLLRARPEGPRFNAHEPAICDALALLDLAGRGSREAILVGIVPGSMDVGAELSDAAAAAIPRALDEIVGHVARFGVDLTRRGESGGLHIELEGIVQGVGMRPWLHRSAGRLGLRGTVANSARGVTLDVFGSPDQLAALVVALESELPPLAQIEAMRVGARSDPGTVGFTILPSEGTTAAQRPSIPADLPLCDACRHEIEDAADRRHRHAFNSCTDCGPRYSLMSGLPYDRERTSMAPFAMCTACAREHADPADRRFHAQGTCCPACGPRLWIESPFGNERPTADPLAEAARRLRSGEIVAVQGLGGIHLACDATDAGAVHRLRARKRREEKPFAVMATLTLARALAEIDDDAEASLTSAAHPIVLVPARPSAIAANVAPASPRIGLLLPYTPLHHLLVAQVDRPLVLTSGNASGDPIAVTRDEARRTLADVADAFLFHDRAIVRRVEDSVVRPRAGGGRVLRRARGYAPRPIRLPFAAPEPVLALGGHHKSTACLVVGDEAYLTPHLGDLESYEAEQAFAADVESFERLFGVRARVVVHDLHPDYASSRYALARTGSARLGIQHHHAHVLAAAAEARLSGQPVVAAAFDGSGFGVDATAWGGEILVVEGLSWTRPYSLRALPLAGGERAVRDVWRGAWALVRDAFGPKAEEVCSSLTLFRRVEPSARAMVGRMLDEQVNVIQARGMGRYFDAFGALCLGQTRATFEGQVATALEAMTHDRPATPYPFAMPTAASATLEASAESELDLRPTTHALVEDLLRGTDVREIATRLHVTFVEATAQLLQRAGAGDGGAGSPRVALVGGCFQNTPLDEGLRERLGAVVLAPGEVPVNDGGLALGQAWAGVLALRAGQV